MRRSRDFIIQKDCAKCDPRDLFENARPQMCVLRASRSDQDALGASVCLWTDTVCVFNLGAVEWTSTFLPLQLILNSCQNTEL